MSTPESSSACSCHCGHPPSWHIRQTYHHPYPERETLHCCECQATCEEYHRIYLDYTGLGRRIAERKDRRERRAERRRETASEREVYGMMMALGSEPDNNEAPAP